MLSKIIKKVIQLIKENQKRRAEKKRRQHELYSYGINNPGAYQERIIYYNLLDCISDKYILSNVYVPYRGNTSEIDVVLLHKSGIYVIESKNYSGWIYGRADQMYWTQVLNRNVKNKFYNPIKQNQTHIKALAEYLKIDASKVKSIIIFSDKCVLKAVPKSTKSVKIIQIRQIMSIIKEIRKSGDCIKADELANMYSRLLPLTNVSEQEKQRHIDAIKSKPYLVDS